MDAILKDGRWWVGSNSWDAILYSYEKSIQLSKTLINCTNCYNCRDCSEFKTNPQRIISPILGSRYSQTTYYWNEERDQIVCGCFIGTMQEFKDKIKKTHNENEFAKGYFKWIEAVETYIAYMS